MLASNQSQFAERCKSHYVEYPSMPPGLLRPLPKHSLDRYNDILSRYGSTVFDETDSEVAIWDLEPHGGEELSEVESKLKSPDEFFGYVRNHETDAHYRHIFINSPNSRAPLDCSIPLAKSIFTYHQVAPFFLDPLITFSEQTDMVQLDLTWCHFKNHNTHSIDPHTVPVPSLDRSNSRIQHSFLLRTVEFSDTRPTRAPGDKGTPSNPGSRRWPWWVRQVAVYHDFDLFTGKQLWMTAKGNDVIREQIKEDTPKYSVFNGVDALMGGEGKDIMVTSLAAALETHLIYFRWCESSWRWFTRDIEDDIRPLQKARNHPVGRARFDRGLPRTRTALASATGARAPPKDDETPTKNPLRAVLCLGRAKSPGSDPEGSPETAEGDDEMHQEAYVLSLFSHKDLQTLTLIHRRIEDGRAILESNRRVLERICQRYRDVRSCYPDNMSQDTRNAISNLISGFIHSTEDIIRDLETWEAGLTTLRTKLEQGDRPMFESILQLRGSHASRMFEEHAHESSIMMHTIADQGRRLAKSTHIVTVIAFWLLWVGLAAAVLQSGILEWDDDGGWSFRRAAVVAFVVIAVPGTLGAAVGWWWWWKRHSEKKDPHLPV